MTKNARTSVRQGPTSRLHLTFSDQNLTLHYPPSLAEDITALFGFIHRGDRDKPQRTLKVLERRDGSFVLLDGEETLNDLQRDDLLGFLIERVVQALITDIDSTPVLHAGAVALGGSSVLIVGATG